MEQDNLKKFIKENLSEFDQEGPSPKVWKEVEKEIEPQKDRFNIKPYLNIAASIIILFSAGLVYFTFNGSENNVDPIVETNDFNQMPKEVMEIESFYASQVDEKITIAKKYEESEELLEEVSNLKEEFETLKAEMEIGINREVVLEAMIDNYKFRLLILEDLLEELEDSNDEKEIDNGKNI